MADSSLERQEINDWWRYDETGWHRFTEDERTEFTESEALGVLIGPHGYGDIALTVSATLKRHDPPVQYVVTLDSVIYRGEHGTWIQQVFVSDLPCLLQLLRELEPLLKAGQDAYIEVGSDEDAEEDDDDEG